MPIQCTSTSAITLICIYYCCCWCCCCCCEALQSISSKISRSMSCKLKSKVDFIALQTPNSNLLMLKHCSLKKNLATTCFVPLLGGSNSSKCLTHSGPSLYTYIIVLLLELWIQKNCLQFFFPHLQFAFKYFSVFFCVVLHAYTRTFQYIKIYIYIFFSVNATSIYNCHIQTHLIYIKQIGKRIKLLKGRMKGVNNPPPSTFFLLVGIIIF